MMDKLEELTMSAATKILVNSSECMHICVLLCDSPLLLCIYSLYFTTADFTSNKFHEAFPELRHINPGVSLLCDVATHLL